MATGGRYRNQGDLITEALANLGVLAPGQAVDPEDQTYVSEKLDSIFRLLAGLEICFVADANNIPGEWFAPLADIVAGECATKFGLSPDDTDKLKKMGIGIPPGTGAAAMTIKTMSRGKPTFEVLRVNYL